MLSSSLHCSEPFISSVYLGSVSDPALTYDCGFLEKLEGMAGVSVMADRGFIIREKLTHLGIELNLPPLNFWKVVVSYLQKMYKEVVQ